MLSALGAIGLEPMHHVVKARCLTKLGYAHLLIKSFIKNIIIEK